MAHRAATGDAPIPGQITSRRNPAYRLKPRPQAPGNSVAFSGAKGREVARAAAILAANAASWRRRRSRSRSQRGPARTEDEERKSRERSAEAARNRREKEEKDRRVEEEQRRLQEAEQKRRWAEQEAKWAEERRVREEQRKYEERRQAERKTKLKGAFAMADDLDEEEENDERARELAARIQKRRATSTPPTPPAQGSPPANSVAALLPMPAAPALKESTSTTLALHGSSSSARPGAKEDAVQLRAALADPSAPRMHTPGEVAEHFRRLSEMKRRFRRQEFGGPDRRRDRSNSRSRDRFDSVWIRPSRRSE